MIATIKIEPIARNEAKLLAQSPASEGTSYHVLSSSNHNGGDKAVYSVEPLAPFFEDNLHRLYFQLYSPSFAHRAGPFESELAAINYAPILRDYEAAKQQQ